jgi:hypothetical protein
MATIKILNKTKLDYRPGWDVTIELSNETKKGNMVFYWPGKDEPDEKILETKFEYFSKQFDEPEPVPEKIYTETDVVKELVTKKYLIEGQKFADLPVKTITPLGVK